jgi:exosortase A
MTIALPGAAIAASVWRRHLGALGLATAVILLLFHAGVVRLVGIWNTGDAYAHCLLVGPIVAWLIWQRRSGLAQLTPAAWAPGLLLVAAGGGGWLLGEAVSANFAQQLGLVLMLQGAVVTLLGPNVARALLFPLAYALFFVPFGAWLDAPLQQVTVAMVMPLLALVGLPAEANGVLIHAGRYWFEVAEACSGAKFVLAMIVLGTLAAHVGFVSWRRRALFMAAALVAPVLTNGLRAFLSIWGANLTSIDSVLGPGHLLAGWALFAGMLAGLLAIAWPHFDRAPDSPAFDPATLRRPTPRLSLKLATLLVLAAVAVFPAVSGTIYIGSGDAGG